ncbi:MAG: hypothetical protein R3264_15945, partial [Anaerolineae bacterium]|nr:hypothetical protein [Anaerolineae bacterium]
MMKQIKEFVFTITYLPFFIVVTPASIWLLANAVTSEGVVLALGGLAAVCLPVAIRFERGRGDQRVWWKRESALLALCLPILLAFVLINAPSGQPPESSPVSHHFTTGRPFPRFALTNLVPEIEQLNFGIFVIPYLDPLLTTGQAERVAGMTIDLYEEMERDPNFQALGSAMGFVYPDQFGQPFEVGHYYLYIPKNQSGDALPVILFLHGYGGNFKVYTWLVSHVAEE